MNPAQHVAEHAGSKQTLQGVINTGKHGIAHKSKDDGIGMQGPDSPEGGVLQFKIEYRVKQLNSCCKPHQHTYQAKNHGSDDESLNDFVVVTEFFEFHRLRCN